MAPPERKTETVNLRLSPRMKDLLRAAAAREHRTISNMIESLVLVYCEQNGIGDFHEHREEPPNGSPST